MNEKAAAIQLIAMDLDNTLLSRGKTISDYAISVFSRCRAAGILLAFATSRSEGASARVSARLKPDLFISNGGALARRGETELFRACLEAQAVEGIVAGCLSAPEISQITLEGERGFLSSEPIDPAWAGWEDYAHSVYTDFANPPCFGAVFKITAEADSDEVVRRIAQGLPGVGILAFSGEGWYQFKAERASKEAALEAAAAALGLKMEQVAAFGDDWSDLGMLRAAGIGVAMQNAIPEVQSAADALCGDCDEDGLAIWIEQNILAAREKG
ncbi:MAG: Cof-type HAD-IIB family hydrolase [Christensenellaceae bacterium]|jgi:Cof subfamily protein (haloacid dehalogenase superfamily)|nr:Cof-type HAD-IIB family hydrolase [Christensenellaceae bacterium]